ncbi:MAG: hypothetical protein P1P85_00940 [Patescibacteria group bacterium]|nr:hypothetical protein [Patescibacteria group bacterium]
MLVEGPINDENGTKPPSVVEVKHIQDSAEFRRRMLRAREANLKSTARKQ